MESKVSAGALLLDEKNPGWFNRIDLERLDLTDMEDCVLGQLYGSYLQGTLSLEIDAKEFGFTCSNLYSCTCSRLNDYWIDEIRNRLNGRPE